MDAYFRAQRLITELFTHADSALLRQVAAEIDAHGFLNARDNAPLRGAFKMIADALRYAADGSQHIERQRDALLRKSL